MKLIILLLAAAALSCAGIPAAKEIKEVEPAEAVKECANYCGTSSILSYRNKTTYFCECHGGEVVVISKTGTIYK
jgi:hypothetical protein